MEGNTVLVSSVFVVNDKDKKNLWFILRNSEDGEWQAPKTVVRKVESSVRAVIRIMGEQGGMTLRVLEEAGRAGGVTRVNKKVLPQRHLYYVAKHISDSGEAIGFEEYEWLEYAKAIRKLSSKREKQMLRQARKEFREWKKKRKKAKKELLDKINPKEGKK